MCSQSIQVPQAIFSHTPKILVIDDEAATRSLFALALETAGCSVTEVESLAELETELKTSFFDAVLTDYCMDDVIADDVMDSVHRFSPMTKCYVMTVKEEVELAVKVMELGARSFVLKSSGPRNVAQKIYSDLKEFQLSIVPSSNYQLIGDSEAMQRLRMQIEMCKDTKAHVLVTGETGSGKELVARALHFGSKRSKERFEAINCAAIPEQLLESELFGHKKGAFTDARSDKQGLFAVCSGGTLFLDEVGDLPPGLQVKLLRVLQDRTIRPVGGERTVDVDTRIVAATHRDLAEAVRKGEFREDLFYRLSILHVEVPPLRDREGDVNLLFLHFLEEISRENGKPIQAPTCEIMTKVEHWPWRGNVRELRNAVERAVIMSTDGTISEEHLFSGCIDVPQPSPELEWQDSNIKFPDTFHEAKQLFERRYMSQILTKSHGNIAAASRLSGKTRVEIYRMIERNEINVDEYRGHA